MSFLGVGAKTVASALVTVTTLVSSAALPEVKVMTGWATPEVAGVHLLVPPPRMTPASVPLPKTPFYPDDMRAACTRSSLSARAKTVYKQLLEHFNRGRRDAFPGYLCLARETGLAKCVVVAAVKELEKYGWIRVRRRMRCCQRDVSEPRSNLYTFDVFPRVQSEDDPLAAGEDDAPDEAEDAKPAPTKPKKKSPRRQLALFGAALAFAPAPTAPADLAQQDVLPADEQRVLDGVRELTTLAHLAQPEVAGLLLSAARRRRASTTPAAVVWALRDLDEKQRLRLVPGSPLPPWSPAELWELALRFARCSEEPPVQARTRPQDDIAEPPPTTTTPAPRAACDEARRSFTALFESPDAQAVLAADHLRNRGRAPP
jgi:hypothetical protein